MAWTVTTPEHGPMAGNGFIVNGVETADASGCEVLKAAPATGLSIFIDHLVINNGANVISITIGEGEAAGAVVMPLIGPIAMAANSSLPFDFTSKGGMKLTAATLLAVDASGAGPLCIFADGRVE